MRARSSVYARLAASAWRLACLALVSTGALAAEEGIYWARPVPLVISAGVDGVKSATLCPSFEILNRVEQLGRLDKLAATRLQKAKCKRYPLGTKVYPEKLDSVRTDVICVRPVGTTTCGWTLIGHFWGDANVPTTLWQRAGVR